MFTADLATRMDNLFWLLIGVACTSAFGLVVWLVKDHFRTKENRIKAIEDDQKLLKGTVDKNKEDGSKELSEVFEKVTTSFSNSLKEHAKEIKASTDKLDSKLDENTLATMALQFQMKTIVESSELTKKLKKDYDVLFQKLRDHGWKLPDPESNT